MLINVEEGLGRVRNNAMLYKRMLSMFIDSKEVGQLEDALAEGNLEAASHEAHSVKGIAGNLSLTDLYNISDILTEELRKDILNEETLALYRDVLGQTQNIVSETIATL